MSKKYVESLIFVALNFISGIVGNLITGWIQQDIWGNVFSFPRITATGITLAITFYALTRIDYWKNILNDNSSEQQKVYYDELLSNVVRMKKKREPALSELLNKVNSIWIKGFLEVTLKNSTLLSINYSNAVNALSYRTIKPILNKDSEVENKLSNIISYNKLFHNSKQNLLILGEPGSGKTFTLLQIAKSLIQAASANPNIPVPVYINLSTWSNKCLPIIDWAAEEIFINYQIARSKTVTWLRTGQITLLLDGLDEVANEKQNDCVKFINDFKSKHQVDVTICCRKSDYENLEIKLNLSSAIYLLPLEEKEVERYLLRKGIEIKTIKEIYKSKSYIGDFGKSPFVVEMISSIYQGVRMDSSKIHMDNEEKWSQLAKEFSEKRLHNITNKNTHLFNPNKSILWLGNLAKNMKREGISTFHINQLEPTWSNNEIEYAALVGLLSGFFIGIVQGIILGLDVYIFTQDLQWSLSVGLSAGIIAALSNGMGGSVSGLIGGKIKNQIIRFFVIASSFLLTEYFFSLTIEPLISATIGEVIFRNDPRGTISVGTSAGLNGAIIMFIALTSIFWKKGAQQVEKLVLTIPNRKQLKKSVINTLGVGIFFGAIVGIYNIITRWNELPIRREELLFFIFEIVIFSSFIFSLFGGIIGAFLSFFQPTQFQSNLSAYQGIKNLFANASKLGILGGLLFGGLGLLQDYLQYNKPSLATLTGLELGLLGGFFLYGGGELLKHYTLRIWLYIKGEIPQNFPAFLSEMVDSGVLRKVGGGYLFPHPLLLKYFSSLETSKRES